MTDAVKELREYLDNGPHDTYEPYEIAHQAITALEAVLELHYERPNSVSALYPDPLCACGLTKPCSTVKAITDALEGDE